MYFQTCADLIVVSDDTVKHFYKTHRTFSGMGLAF